MENQLFYPNIHWNATRKFLLRFALVFFGLQILPILSFIGDDVYPWIAKTIFSVSEISLEPTGSGDMYYNYMELFLCFVLATVSSLVWSLFNKREKGYDILLHYFLIFCRYYVAYSLISYGYSKIFYSQFGAPGLGRLLQPYGDSSPMGIAWTFIGASKPYTMFSGFAELVGGILLLFRRTAVLGALIGFAVMLNVMMMNFCYDIPVKLYATQLVVLSFIIMYGMGDNLKQILIHNKPTTSVIFKPLFQKKWINRSHIILKIFVLFYLLGFDGYNQYLSIEEYGPDAPKAPLYGIYKPQQLIKNNDTLKLYSDSTEWKNFIVEYAGFASIKQLNDRSVRLVFEVDTSSKTIITHERADTINKYSLKYKLLNDTTLQLNGIYKKDTINYVLGKVNLKSFRLINRGFHWVNEYPYNR
jgi:uncharacterized membrane protein YphA (DoxX/SURF4 family)